MIDEFVWGIFVVDNYQLLRMPINYSFAYYHKKSGKLVGMDGIHHEHFHFKDGSK